MAAEMILDQMAVMGCRRILLTWKEYDERLESHSCWQTISIEVVHLMQSLVPWIIFEFLISR